MNRDYRARNNPRRSSRRYAGRRDRYESGGGIAPLAMIIIILMGAYVLKGEEILGYGKVIWQKVQGIQGIGAKQAQVDTVPVYSMPCMEANAAKIIAYTLLDPTQIVDEPGDQWYSKYYRALEKDNRFDFFKIENALQPVTYAQTSEILSDVLGDGYGVRLDTSEEAQSKHITFEKFLEIYDTALMRANNGQGLSYETLSIISTPATNKGLGAWQVATNKGRYGFEGLIIDPFKDCTLKVVVKGDEILGIAEAISSQSSIEQCYISEVTEETVTLKIGEEEIVYKNQGLQANNKGLLGTVTVKEGRVIGFELEEAKPKSKESSTNRILRITDTYIELEQEGKLPYKDVEVYDNTPGGTIKNVAQIPVGVGVECVIKDNIIETIQIVEKDFGSQIRVLISTDGLGDYTHDEVILTSQGEYEAMYNGKKLVFQKGGTWSASDFEWQEGLDKVTFVPQTDSKMEVTSIKRQGKNPGYNGNIEITKEVDGSFTLVNEVDMENYLAGVIPSEMPTKYGIEAAKVQAIAARSYAVTHQSNSKFAKYGAQVDDTTATQVYNNVPADEISYQAAKETKDLVLKHDGKAISGNFFSTSAGYTANFGDVWAQGENFPANTPHYLVTRQQYVGDTAVSDISQEKDAYKFFTTPAAEIDAFDNHSPWFRWQIELSAEELAHIINANVQKLTTQSPHLVKVLIDDKWQEGEIETLGAIKDLKVEKRGEGGNIMELVVVGEKGAIKVETEYLIRCLLAPVQKDSTKEPIKIVRADESEVENMNMLPSAFFSMDTTYDKNQMIKTMTIYGGGFGHGVGMSQEGVKGMVERGFKAEDILEHFYQDIAIESYIEQ